MTTRIQEITYYVCAGTLAKCKCCVHTHTHKCSCSQENLINDWSRAACYKCNRVELK